MYYSANRVLGYKYQKQYFFWSENPPKMEIFWSEKNIIRKGDFLIRKQWYFGDFLIRNSPFLINGNNPYTYYRFSDQKIPYIWGFSGQKYSRVWGFSDQNYYRHSDQKYSRVGGFSDQNYDRHSDQKYWTF